MGQPSARTTEQMSNLCMRLPGVVRTAQGEITLCNYSRKYLAQKKKKKEKKLKKKNRHSYVTAMKEEKQARRLNGKERGRVIILCAAAAAVKMLGRDAMRQSKEAAPMHPANLVTWKIKQGGTLSL